MTTNGGYGVLYGPNVALDGTVNSAAGAGKIGGTEYLAYSLDASGKAAATLMVQVPSTFNAGTPMHRDRDLVRIAASTARSPQRRSGG